MRQTRLLSLEKAESGFLPQKALRHFPQAGQKKNCSYPSDQNMDSSGGSSQQTLVEVRDVFIHTSTKHALKKTAFLREEQSFASRYCYKRRHVVRGDDDARAEKTERGERFFVGFGREVRRYLF